MECESCGMPMQKKEEFGGGNEENKYCVYCTDAQGNLKSRDEVRQGMIGFYMQMKNATKEEAEKIVDEQMAKMPAWK
jgi:thioredoxin-related protein